MSYWYRRNNILKWDESKVNRGKTSPGTNEGSFAPKDAEDLRQRLAPHPFKLVEENKKASDGLNRYTSSGYKLANKYLRGELSLSAWAEEEGLPVAFMQEHVTPDLEALVDYIRNSPALPEDTVVYRGVKDTSHLNLESLSEGSTLKLKGITSTSTRQTQAKRWAQASKGLVMEIRLHKGVGGVLFTTNDKEGEVLLPPEASFRVVKKTPKTLVLDYMGPRIEKWDESQVNRGKTVPGTNDGSFAPKNLPKGFTSIPAMDATKAFARLAQARETYTNANANLENYDYEATLIEARIIQHNMRLKELPIKIKEAELAASVDTNPNTRQMLLDFVEHRKRLLAETEAALPKLLTQQANAKLILEDARAKHKEALLRYWEMENILEKDFAISEGLTEAEYITAQKISEKSFGSIYDKEYEELKDTNYKYWYENQYGGEKLRNDNPAAAQALDEYIGPLYGAYNDVFRIPPDKWKVNNGPWAADSYEEYQHKVKLLENLISSRPEFKEDVLVYRGVKDREHLQFSKMNVGDTLEFLGFGSMSSSLAIARGFAGDNDKTNMLMKILIPKGSKDVLVTTNDLEQEFLANHGVGLKYLGVEYQRSTRRNEAGDIVVEPNKKNNLLVGLFEYTGKLRKAEAPVRNPKTIKVNFGRMHTRPTVVEPTKKR